MDARLTPVALSDIAGFAQDDHAQSFAAFLVWARAARADVAATRAAQPASPALMEIARRATSCGALDAAAARAFYAENFAAFRVFPANGDAGFLTGYYEPRLKGSLTPTAEFSAPVLARPDDLVSFAPGAGPGDFDPALAGAQRFADGRLGPYPDRAEIEAQAPSGAVLWLADCVDVFLVQVQGSAQVELPDGRIVRLAYDGRNGQPYTSIGKLLIASGDIGEAQMSLGALKAWLRAHGLAPGAPARRLMQRNRSYVFFKLEADFDASMGPVGGAGLALTPLRSIAIDRQVWSYGLPFFIEAEAPWQNAQPSRFARLMMAQDTGSAILGPARADIFFGGGEAAGERAGAIRCPGNFTVLLPVEDAP